MTDLYRAQGILDIGRTKSQKLIFVGLGSLGSLTLENLAYPWREVVLADPDELSLENIERHLIKTDAAIGMAKVEAVAQWLTQSPLKPEKVTAYQGKAQDILDEHTDADLVIVNIDKRSAKAEINAWCYDHNVPALYGGVYPMGTAGQVAVIPDPHKACYQCAEFMMGVTDEKPKGPVDYGIDITQLIDDDGDDIAVPALHPAVNMIAVQMAQLALSCLKEDHDVTSMISVTAGQAWEPIMEIDPGDAIETVAKFIELMPKLGFLPTLQLRKDEAYYSLMLHGGSLAMKLWRSKLCSLHAKPVAISDI